MKDNPTIGEDTTMTDNLERIAPDTVTLVRDGAIHTLPVLRTIAHP